ncbi:MAG: hypothetical protein VYC29_00250, partial [Pseudomonadota bacterium]|nr:hypothetical protein [Pseudomonadota bacterium]
HPDVLKPVALRAAALTGGDGEKTFQDAIDAALTSLTANHVSHLSVRAAEKSVRERIFASLPTRQDIEGGISININVDVSATFSAEEARLRDAIAERDFVKILSLYPVRETAMLGILATKLGFRGRSDYEKAVRKLLVDDASALTSVRGLLDDLPETINATGV